MRHRSVLVLLSVLLLSACLLNYRPWREFRPDKHVDFGAEPIKIAQSLRDEGTFANPFAALRTGETAHIAPGFPFLLFAILQTFGENDKASAAIQALPVLALGLELALLPWMAEWLGFSLWTGALAGVLGIITKPGLEPQWEAHVAGLLCLITVGAFGRWLRDGATKYAVASAIFAGMLFYVQPICAIPWVASVILARWKRLQVFGTRPIHRDIGILLAVPLILCLPWSLRNYRQIGTPWMRDNAGLELYVSFSDCTPPGFQENLESFCFQERHPNISRDEAGDVQRLGEYQYNRDRLRRALAWIAAHPGASAKLIAQRFWLFWFPVNGGLRGYMRQNPRYWLGPIVTLASLLGLYLCRGRRNPPVILFGMWLALFPIVYYVVQFSPRYRAPILWITWLLAAHTAIHVFQHMQTPAQLRDDRY